MTKIKRLETLVEMISTYHMYNDIIETTEVLEEHYGKDNFIDNFYLGFNFLSKEDLLEVIWYLLTEHFDYAIDDILELLNTNIEDYNYQSEYGLLHDENDDDENDDEIEYIPDYDMDV